MLKYLKTLLLMSKLEIKFLKDIILSSTSFILTVLLYSSLWFIIFNQSSERITFISKDGAMIYVIIVYSIMNTLSRNPVKLITEIKNGELNYIFVKPINYINYKMAIYMGYAIIDIIIYFSVGTGLYYVLGYSLNINIISLIIIIPIVLVLSILLSALLTLFFQVFSFWLEDSSALQWFNQKSLFFFGGLFFPLEFYPLIVQNISNYLPFQYVLNKPALVIQSIIANGKNTTTLIMQTISGQIIFIVFLYCIVSILFNKGKKRLNAYGG